MSVPALEWSLEPAIAIPLAATAALYAFGVVRLRSQQRKRRRGRSGIASFGAGLLVAWFALLSPLHEMSEQLFSAHMLQHELLMVVAAPLLVVGRPSAMFLWAVPMSTRRAIRSVLHTRRWHFAWHGITKPLNTWLIHAMVIWGWHIPALFQATLRNDAIHALQHLSFLGSALLFWWAVVHPRQQSSLGISIVYLFTTAVHTAVLGALMTFARAPWFPDYVLTVRLWGVTAMQDQQAAGLLMWIPASIAYLVAALLIARRWLSASEWRVAHHERSIA